MIGPLFQSTNRDERELNRILLVAPLPRTQTIKREEIEKKLDKADAEEKEAVKKERQSLIRSRKDKQTHLKDIEVKMERVEIVS